MYIAGIVEYVIAIPCHELNDKSLTFASKCTNLTTTCIINWYKYTIISANGKIKLILNVINNIIYAKLAIGMLIKFATMLTKDIFLNAETITPVVPICTASIVAIVPAIFSLNILFNNFVSGFASNIIDKTAIKLSLNPIVVMSNGFISVTNTAAIATEFKLSYLLNLHAA